MVSWWKESIVYTVPLRSFYDANADGIGDFQGLIQKLDYLEDLGVNTLHLLPFFPSPRKDDGYDVLDFMGVDKDYGTLQDFDALVAAVHQRQMRLIIDMVFNHTSNEHPWFKAAVQASEGSVERDFYVWSYDQSAFKDASVVFKDFESSNWTYEPSNGKYYWHRFFSHQPDLNFYAAPVRQAMWEALCFWLDRGVDGVRLTSLMYIGREEHSDCENLPFVHEYLRDLRQMVDAKYKDKAIIAETNLWIEEAAEYIETGQEAHLNFHYSLSPRLFIALETEDNFPLRDIWDQTPAIHSQCSWGLFLRNHDDMMLSKVTDEDRDYLYRAYAKDPSAKINSGIRRRLAPLLANDRRKIELMHVLLLSMPVVPFMYYGDEIGMGDNIFLGDRDGVRTPMQWNADRNAGFSRANPQQLYLPVVIDPQFRFEAINVETQLQNASSFLWWIKNTLFLRKQHTIFKAGDFAFVDQANPKVLTFKRQLGDEVLLVVCNLSRFSQSTQLDLHAYRDRTPIELFSSNPFREIEENPYSFTLSPYGYFWLLLEKQQISEGSTSSFELPYFETSMEFSQWWWEGEIKRLLERQILPNYLPHQRWYGGKAKTIASVDIKPFTFWENGLEQAVFMMLEIQYTAGAPDAYFMPLALQPFQESATYVVAEIAYQGQRMQLVDAFSLSTFRAYLFASMIDRKTYQTLPYLMQMDSGSLLDNYETQQVQSQLLKVQQSNSSIIYEDAFFFKVFRKLDVDINPDLELVRHLTEKAGFKNGPQYAGSIQLYNLSTGNHITLGLMQNKIDNQGDAWDMFQDRLSAFFEKVLTQQGSQGTPDFSKLISPVSKERVRLLGQRTAEMHMALAIPTTDEDFTPELFTQHYQRSLYDGFRKLSDHVMHAVARKYDSLPKEAQVEIAKIRSASDQIDAKFQEIYATKIPSAKTRIHGDYHLGQVLFNGKDFFIIDFEGEPMHTIGERRLKKTPFKDLAGMVRSLHYAAYGQLFLNAKYKQEDRQKLQLAADVWFSEMKSIYLQAWLEGAKGSIFLPEDPTLAASLLNIYMLEKALYELDYELNNRPDWLIIPLKGVLDILNF